MPPTTHTASARPPEPDSRTTAPGVRKMPDPMTVPTTMKIRSRRVRVRRSWSLMEALRVTYYVVEEEPHEISSDGGAGRRGGGLLASGGHPGRATVAGRHSDRSVARLRRHDGVLADRRGLQAGKGRRRRDAAGLLLRGEQFRDVRARRHAHRRARALRQGARIGRSDSARSAGRRRGGGGRDGRLRVTAGLPRDHRRLRRVGARHGPIPAGAIVLIRTGYARFWPDAARYLG